MSPRGRDGRVWKTVAVTFLVVFSNVIGNLCLSLGMKTPAGMFSPWIAAGIALLILWTLSRMTLLSWADLSYVLPVTAVGYPLSAFAGKFFLGEQITPQRWAGTALILAGMALVGLTSPSSGRSK
ncbi:MAG: hypothetical protein HYZ37_18750 [Candidatus Solibacter usitatus]|nr:hypothetical protein [Candidatus Solibacter usitatus]